MAIKTAEAVEVRIRNYTDDQLAGIRKSLDEQSVKLALGISRGGILSQLRVLSSVAKAAGCKGFMYQEATAEDVVTVKYPFSPC